MAKDKKTRPTRADLEVLRTENARLTDVVDTLEHRAEYLDSRINALKSENDTLKEKLKSYEGEINTRLSQSDRHQRDLLEIIRWHANPSTAQYPFSAEKTQRDGGSFRNY